MDLLELALSLADENSVDVRIDDDKVIAVKIINGIKRASIQRIADHDEDIGHAVHQAVLKAIQVEREKAEEKN